MNNTYFNIYSNLIIVFGVVIAMFGIATLKQDFYTVVIFILMAVITESLAVEVADNSNISLGFAIGLASIILFNPAIAGLIMFLGFMLQVEKTNNGYKHLFNTDPVKRFFNSGAAAMTAFFAAIVYNNMSVYFINFRIVNLSMIGIISAVVTFVFINTMTYSILFSILSKKSLMRVVYEYSWVAKQFLAIAPLGILLAIAQNNYGVSMVALYFGPLLLARFTFIQYLKMKDIYLKTINAFTKAIDAKDKYTIGHSERVADYTIKLARQMNLSEKVIDELKSAALLHDIGKIGIADEILNKPGKLTDEEFNIVKEHPGIGADILSEIEFLRDTSSIVRHHHERFDGFGYPDQLAGDQIVIGAAIISVVDAYDAMTSDRAYRRAMTSETAMNIIGSEAGKQFNPRVVENFIQMMAIELKLE